MKPIKPIRIKLSHDSIQIYELNAYVGSLSLKKALKIVKKLEQ